MSSVNSGDLFPSASGVFVFVILICKSGSRRLGVHRGPC